MAVVNFDPRAKDDLIGAIAYYNDKDPSLGKKFLDLVLNKAALISIYPRLGKKVHKSYRKIVLNKFPFDLFYVFNAKRHEVLVIAVIHQRRHPDKWLRRMNSG